MIVVMKMSISNNRISPLNKISKRNRAKYVKSQNENDKLH